MSAGLNPALAYAAGAVTILSPCVLPLVPIVMASAGRAARFGPLALAVGLVASFTLVGFALAVLGTASGLDGDLLRQLGAAMLLLVGLLLLLPKAQALTGRLAAPAVNWASDRQSTLERFGLIGQAGIGALLGVVWSPCVGPTLGAAIVLAAEGKDHAEVAFVMAAFGSGIATMLLILALATRKFLARWRGTLMSTGDRGRRVLGALLVLVAFLILTGGDRLIEGLIVEISPVWLTDFTTSI